MFKLYLQLLFLGFYGIALESMNLPQETVLKTFMQMDLQSAGKTQAFIQTDLEQKQLLETSSDNQFLRVLDERKELQAHSAICQRLIRLPTLLLRSFFQNGNEPALRFFTDYASEQKFLAVVSGNEKLCQIDYVKQRLSSLQTRTLQEHKVVLCNSIPEIYRAPGTIIRNIPETEFKFELRGELIDTAHCEPWVRALSDIEELSLSQAMRATYIFLTNRGELCSAESPHACFRLKIDSEHGQRYATKILNAIHDNDLVRLGYHCPAFNKLDEYQQRLTQSLSTGEFIKNYINDENFALYKGVEEKIACIITKDSIDQVYQLSQSLTQKHFIKNDTMIKDRLKKTEHWEFVDNRYIQMAQDDQSILFWKQKLDPHLKAHVYKQAKNINERIVQAKQYCSLINEYSKKYLTPKQEDCLLRIAHKACHSKRLQEYMSKYTDKAAFVGRMSTIIDHTLLKNYEIFQARQAQNQSVQTQHELLKLIIALDDIKAGPLSVTINNYANEDEYRFLKKQAEGIALNLTRLSYDQLQAVKNTFTLSLENLIPQYDRYEWWQTHSDCLQSLYRLCEVDLSKLEIKLVGNIAELIRNFAREDKLGEARACLTSLDHLALFCKGLAKGTVEQGINTLEQIAVTRLATKALTKLGAKQLALKLLPISMSSPYMNGLCLLYNLGSLIVECKSTYETAKKIKTAVETNNMEMLGKELASSAIAKKLVTIAGSKLKDLQQKGYEKPALEAFKQGITDSEFALTPEFTHKIAEFNKKADVLAGSYGYETVTQAKQILNLNHKAIIERPANLLDLELMVKKLTKINSNPRWSYFKHEGCSLTSKVTLKSVDEALTAIAAEEQGFFNTLKRSFATKADFSDANGTLWDVKTALSRDRIKSQPIFKVKEFLGSVKKEFTKGENVIVDITLLDQPDLKQLLESIKTTLTKDEIKRTVVIHQDNPLHSKWLEKYLCS